MRARSLRRTLRRRRPLLSVVICTYEMSREAPRTMLSAGVPYQKGVDPGDYEVIVVDNGSSELPRPPEEVPSLQVLRYPHPRPSPVFAMNWAAERASGDFVLFAIDGARIFSDGLYCKMLEAHRLVEDALVYTLAWHLGPEEQMSSVHKGYDQAKEDELLAASGWPERPASLWEISAFAGSSDGGFFQPIAESNAFSVPRKLLARLGGYDERYTSPGGGLCNLEMFRRYVTHPDVKPVCLLSEGTFHQVHGGIATSGKVTWSDLVEEHRRISGEPDFELPRYRPLYYGTPRPEMVPFVEESCRLVAGGGVQGV